MANSLTSPSDLGGSAWRLLRATASLNATTAPDGTTTADKLQEDNTTNTHFAIQDNPDIDTSGATRWRQWVFFKPGERTRFLSESDDAFYTAGGCYAHFNCAGAGNVNAADTGTWGTSTTIVSTSIQALTGANAGWYYCKVVFDTTNTRIAPYWILDNGSGTAGGSLNYAGTTGNGGYFWEFGLAPDATADNYTAILNPGLSVTGAQTLSSPTNASTTAVIDAVTGSQTLSRPTNTSTTAVIDAVTGAQTLARPTHVSTTAVIDAVTGAQILPAVQQSGTISATNNRTINGANTLSAPTQTSTTAVIDAVTGSQILGQVSQTFSVALLAQVTGAQTLSRPSQSSAIVVTPFVRSITGAQTLAQLSQASNWNVVASLTGAQTLAPVTQTSSITPVVTDLITISGAQILLPVIQHMETYFYPWRDIEGSGPDIWTDRPDPGSVWTSRPRPGDL